MKKYVVVVLFAVCIRYASSIHCYNCNSQNNSMCLDPTIYDKESLGRYLPVTECNRGVYSGDHTQKFFCRKIVQTILHKGYEPEVRVTRGCGWIRHHKKCYKADNEDHLETVCQCFSDACNGAPGAPLAAAAVLATALAKLLI